MPVSAPLLLRLLACSASAAVRAGAYIREVMRSGELGIVVKGHNDLQTQADRGAQRLITANLRAAFPGLTVIGEEEEDPTAAPLGQDEIVEPLAEVLRHCHRCPPEASGAQQEDLTVWVDPLDGTSEFADNLLDNVTVLIGVALRGHAVAGVVYQPYHNYLMDPRRHGRLVWGLDGLGVFGLNGDSRRLASTMPPTSLSPSTNCIVVTTRSHSSDAVEKAVKACQPSQILRVGGCGHKVLLLLERRAHVYAFASDGCKKWDTCGPEALLRAAGGRLTDMFGRPLTYHADAVRKNAHGVLAALLPEDHARCVANMPPELAQQFTI